MNSEVEGALEALLCNVSVAAYEEDLRSLIAEIQSLGCANLIAKLHEFQSGRVGDLIAELRMARSLTLQLGF